MERHIPASIYEGVPCSLVALRIAADHYRLLAEMRKVEFERKDDFCRILDNSGAKLHADGYCPLSEFNKMVRYVFPKELIIKRQDFRRGERPALKDMVFTTNALACVKGHFVFVEKDGYWSFFDNDNDEIVAMWLLR